MDQTAKPVNLVYFRCQRCESRVKTTETVDLMDRRLVAVFPGSMMDTPHLSFEQAFLLRGGPRVFAGRNPQPAFLVESLCSNLMSAKTRMKMAKMEKDPKELVRSVFDDQPLLDVGEYRFLINPLTEQIPATSAALLRAASSWLVEEGDFDLATKIAGEEDKGAILVAAVALETDLPFGMARWYPSGLADQVGVEFEMEYTSGQLYLNGVEREDQVIIVDDMISTGGTLLALIEAVENVGASIVDIVCVAGKVEYGGAARVKKETGYQVKTLLEVSIAGERSRVI